MVCINIKAQLHLLFRHIFCLISLGLMITTCSNATTNNTQIHDPRNELYRERTSGEESWLKSLGLNDQDPSQVFSDKKESKRHIDTVQHNPQKKIESKEHKIIPMNSIIGQELLRLSKPHGLEPSTIVDRATVAELLNTVQSDDIKVTERNISKMNTAHYFLGLIYLYDLSGSEDRDISKALVWFQNAAENNHADSQCALGLILYYGIDGVIGKDRKSAMRWFYRASIDSDHPRGHWLLGKAMYEGLYYDDIGITTLHEQENVSNTTVNSNNHQKRNFIEAAKLFEKAAAHKVPEALHQLAIMYEYSLIGSLDNVKQNYKKAMTYYERAANLEYVESLYHIGLMYCHGRGVALSHTTASEYFRRGAMNNHSPSMRYLAIFAMNGYDQPDEMSNPKEALFWFDKCIHHATHLDTVKELCTSEQKELQLMINNIRSHQSKVFTGW